MIGWAKVEDGGQTLIQRWVTGQRHVCWDIPSRTSYGVEYIYAVYNCHSRGITGIWGCS